MIVYPTTRWLATINLALSGIEADIAPETADTSRREFRFLYGLLNGINYPEPLI